MTLLSHYAHSAPEKIEKLFITKEVNSSGCYALRLMRNRKFVTIVIDDYVPYDTKTRRLIYAQKRTKNIWPILLEKALAKYKGSYEDIESNISEDAKFFFPCTFSTHKHISENDDEVMEFNQIYSHVKTGSMVT